MARAGNAYGNIKENKKISQCALSIEIAFNADCDGDEFLSRIISEFDAYQTFCNKPESTTFSGDFNYIIQCTTKTLTAPVADTRFQNRIEAYFHIYNKIQYHFNKKMQARTISNTDAASVNQLRTELLAKLADIFKSTNGAEPNISSNNMDILRTLNIVNYLSMVQKVDDITIHMFFVLCKLALQLPLKCRYQPTLQWKSILLPKTFEMSLDNFIASYETYKEAFQFFPLDMEAFIYLIEKLHLHKKDQHTRLLGFPTLAEKLDLDQDAFFEKFLPIFRIGAIQNRYQYMEVAELINILSTNITLLREYLSFYNANGSNDVIWSAFFHLSETYVMNELVQEQLVRTFSARAQMTAVQSFLPIIENSKSRFENVKAENIAYYTIILGAVFETFIKILLAREKNYSLVADADWKALLKCCFTLSTINVVTSQSTQLIIKRLLFPQDNSNQKRNSIERIQTLFRTLKDFDQDFNPNNALADMIDDGWLQNLLMNIPEEFCTRLNYNVYQDLCTNYQNNLWIDFIWSRITHLSIMRSITGNSYNLLVKLNKWMIDVGHNVFNVNDTFTITLIINLFENIIKHTNSVFSLPNIPCIIDFILHIKQEQIYGANIEEMDKLITNAQREIEDILQLKAKRPIYEALSTSSIVDYFLRNMNLEELLEYLTLPQWIFPRTTPSIESIVSIPRPEDIDIANVYVNEGCFKLCIEKGCEWLKWFDRFFDVFEYPLEWFKDHRVDGAFELFVEINSRKNNQMVTLIQMRTTAEKLLELLKPLDQLFRFCHLFNCLTSFKVITAGKMDSPDDRKKFLADIKASRSNTKFDITPRGGAGKMITINKGQHIHWFLASENYPCNIKIEYTTSDNQYNLLFEEDRVAVFDRILNGEFETQKGGSLLISIDNSNSDQSRVIWYRVMSNDLSKCQLFNGIFDLCYSKFSQHSKQAVHVDHLNILLNDAFKFVDELLDGTISVKKMFELKPVFCDKNIVVPDEVRNLFTNRSYVKKPDERNVNNLTDKDIQDICERLQIYQYYSHINNIIDCIEGFEILPANTPDKLFNNLKQIRNDKNDEGDGVAGVDKFLQDQLKRFSSLHLQLIKTMLESPAVVKMMKTSNLYANQERRRFQELRDNLTTQFQLQERNNMILNSLIVTYVLCEPFATKAESFAEFANRLAQLSNVDDNSLKHIKVINENIQIVNMWLSTEVTNVLDNALITMEYLYKSGTVNVHLKRLMNNQSYYDIDYYVDQMQKPMLRMGSTEDDEEIQDVTEIEQHRTDKIKFNLSIADVDDHKRQLTFCNIDLQQNMAHTKLLLNEQLKILRLVEQIYSVLIKLEKSGHPDYQLKEEKYEIFDKTSDVNKILSELKKGQKVTERELEAVIQLQTKTLELTYQLLDNKHNLWLRQLEKYRQEYHLLKLFTNRQIMIMIILLASPTSHNKVKQQFLEKLCSSNDTIYSQDTEVELAVQGLMHYLRSLRLNKCDLSKENLSRLYKLYNIPSFEDGNEFLKKFCQFIQQLFNDGKELFSNDKIPGENQQYFVALNPTRETTDNTSIDHNLDLRTCCILLNIFKNRLPSFYQILWCSTATEDDIRLFFVRIRTFHHLTFVVMEMDHMHHRLREQLLNEQNLLAQQQEPHASVYYFSQDAINCQKALLPFPLKLHHQDSTATHDLLMKLFQENNTKPPNIEIISGKPGVGKTHRINKDYKDPNTLCFSINDKLNLALLTSSLVSYDSKASNTNPSVYFNISIHAPFEVLTRTLFSLFVCGSLVDPYSGFTFSLLPTKTWKFIIEIPFTNKCNTTIQQNLSSILPILSIISPSTIDEVTDDNYKLSTGAEEELVARFLKAYENKTINRILTVDSKGKETPVIFDEITSDEERREHIYKCLNAYANELSREKVLQLSFIKFLYRRVRFFLSAFIN